MDSIFIESAEYKIRIEKAINNLGGNLDVISSELVSIGHLTTLSTSDKQYLLYIINRDEFKLEHITVLDNTLSHVSYLDTELYIDIMVNLSRFQNDLNSELVKYSTRALYDKNIENFQYAIIGLITHSNGYIRRLGRNIWDKYNLQSSTIDISALDETIQFPFIVSMLQDDGNPEVRLPKLLPLLDSKNAVISSLLLHQLHSYILNYRGHVIAQIDKLDIKNKDAVKTIKEYCNSIGEFAKKRTECKELNPINTQTHIVKEFASGFQEYVNQLFKTSKEDSILTCFKDVRLARGICYRDNDGKEMELPHIKTSTPATSMNGSFTYFEMVERFNKILMDWSCINKADDLWKIL